MARYRVTHAGGVYEITAPDDMSEADVMAQAQASLGQSKPDRFAGWTDDQRKDYEIRKRTSNSVADRMSDSALLGGKDEILAGLNTAVQAPFAFWQGDHDIAGRYNRNLQVERALRDDARKATSGYGLALDIAGGMALGAPKAIASGLAAAAPAAKGLAASFVEAAPQLAKTGAAWGGGHAFLDKDPRAGASTMEGFGERISEVPGGAAAGALGSLAFGGAIMGGLGARDWIRARRVDRTQRQSAVADEMRSVGITEPFGPAVSESGTAQKTAQSLSGSVVGEPVRRAAGRNVDELTQAAQQAVRQHTDGLPAADLGADIQGTLRAKLTQRSIPDDEVAGMSSQALERMTGPVSDGGFKPPRPTVDPVQPRTVPPQDPRRFNPSFEPAPVNPKYPTPESIQAEPRLASDIEIARPAAEKARAFIETNQAAYDEASRVVSAAAAKPHSPLTLQNRYNSDPAFRNAYDTLARLEPEIAKAKSDIAKFDVLRDQIETGRNAAWKDAVKRAHDEARMAADAENVQRRAAAQREAAQAETARLQEQARLDAERATAAKQRAADQQYEQTVAQRPGFEAGRSRESYPTEFSAAYERVGREMPSIQRNPLGQSKNDPAKTSTLNVLGEFAREARRSGLFQGYRNEGIFALGDNLMHPQLRKYLSKRLGNDVTARLEYLVERRAKGQFVPDTQVLNDMRTAIGREIDALKRARRMGETRTQDEAMLSRLYGAMTSDMHGFLQQGGEAGQRASGMMRTVDDAYRLHMEEVRKPLSKLFGDKVQPIEAMDRLAKAAEDGNLQLLRSYARVMAEKGDPVRSAVSIVAHVTQGARDLQSFVSGMRRIPADSRAVLFTGENGRAVRTELEKLERIGTRLLPYARNADGGGVDLTKKTNIALAVGAMSHFYATAAATVGMAGMAKFMASPRYLRWLTTTPHLVNGIGSQSAAQHVARLQAIAGSDPQFGDAFLKAAMDTFTPSKARADGGKDGGFFTSLEKPPSAGEVNSALRSGVRQFDFDLEQNADPAAVRAIKDAGGKITAYHVGGGGGRAWGSKGQGEQVRKYDNPADYEALAADVKRLVALGADSIHFDNTHRMSGKKLEAIADTIVKAGAGFVAKNNADKWNLVMRRRPDLKPDYAIIENAMHDADETQAAHDLHARGVRVRIVGFRKPLEKGGHPVDDGYAKEYATANPWAEVILMDDERAYEGRTAKIMKGGANGAD